MQTAIDVAATRLPAILMLEGEAWSEFDYWAHQHAVNRSRARCRAAYEASGIKGIAPMPAQVDYGAALAFGYALRCCGEVSDFERTEPAYFAVDPWIELESAGDAGGAGGEWPDLITRLGELDAE